MKFSTGKPALLAAMNRVAAWHGYTKLLFQDGALRITVGEPGVAEASTRITGTAGDLDDVAHVGVILRKFLDLIRAAPSSVVEFEMARRDPINLKVSSGRWSARFETLPVENMPTRTATAVMDGAAAMFSGDASIFVARLREIEHAQRAKEGRTMFAKESGAFQLYATDGKRLAHVALSAADGSVFSACIGSGAVGRIIHSVDPGDSLSGTVVVSRDSRGLTISTPWVEIGVDWSTEAVSLQGLRAVIAKARKNTDAWTIDVDEGLAMLGRAEALGLSREDQGILLTANGIAQTIGKTDHFSEEMIVDGAPVRMLVNPDYFRDALAAIGSGTVRVLQKDAASAVLIEAVDAPTSEQILMPMNLPPELRDGYDKPADPAAEPEAAAEPDSAATGVAGVVEVAY